MSTSYDGIQDLLKTLDRLQKNLDILKGASGEKANANPSFEQSPHDSTTQSQKRESIAKKRSNLNTSGKDVTVCNKCLNKGHLAASCRSSWTKEGKFIGTGEPKPGDFWTQKHAADLKKKAAMVKKTPPQQQQQQTAQKHKRNAEKDFEEGLLKQQKRKKIVQA
jgi:hypothetical protein